MTIQIDLGNSAAKWRVLQRDSTAARGVFTHAGPLPGELLPWLTQDRQVQVASVASESATEDLLTRLRAQGASRILCAESQPRMAGLVNAYGDPRTMGVDRWLGMLGAWTQAHEALIVVDAGSALTIDVVRADGHHIGGFILPGRGLMLKSLQRDTSRVLFQLSDDPSVELGVDTQGCVLRGLSWLWQGVVGQIQSLAGSHFINTIWITGGDARHLQDAGLIGTYSQDLVLDGLAVYCDVVARSQSRR